VLALSGDISIWLHHSEAGYTASIESSSIRKDLSKHALPLGYAQEIAEDWARKHRVGVWAQKDAAWRQGQPSEKQLETLEKLKIQPRDGMTRGDASLLIGQKMGQRKLWAEQLPTPKQIWCLRQNGIKISPSITKGEASRLIATAKGQAKHD
jgi:hypothetical protein